MRLKICSRKVELYIPDMFFRGVMNGRLNRYDIAARYLAIENYFGKNDFGFKLYSKMQELRMNIKGYGAKAESQFRALLDSYQSGGYDRTSRIILDKTLSLLDGSHRIAANIYFHEPMISALSLGLITPIDFSLDWFIANGFTHDEIDAIKSKADEIAQKLIQPFLCIVWSPAVKFAEEIAEDLKYFGEVSEIRHYTYSEEEYANIVRAVYSVDDIAKWKIEKKIQYMAGSGGNIALIPLTIKYPDFRVKGSSHLPLSRSLERVKAAIRSRYKARIPNYFYDICFHVGDNYMQNDYIRNVFEPEIDMRGIMDIFSCYDYAFVKTDVPYMPAEFPERIPAGKDADILCSAESFSGIVNDIDSWCRNNTPYDVRTIAEEAGSRIRMELYGRLIYQIDISCEILGLGAGFVNDALKHKVHNGKYYIISPEYEYIYRFYVWSSNKCKAYHLDYLKNHRGDYDSSLADKYCGDGISL